MHLQSPRVRGDRESENTGDEGWERSGMRIGDRRGRARRRGSAGHSCSQVATSCFPAGQIYQCAAEFKKSKSKVVSARHFVSIFPTAVSFQLPWACPSINVNCPIFHSTRHGLARPTLRRNLDQVSRIRNIGGFQPRMKLLLWIMIKVPRNERRRWKELMNITYLFLICWF